MLCAMMKNTNHEKEMKWIERAACRFSTFSFQPMRFESAGLCSSPVAIDSGAAMAERSIRSIGGAEMALLGLKGRRLCQLLRNGEQQVALDEFEPPGRPYPAGSDASSLSFQHLALVVDDTRPADARLRDVAPISVAGPQHLPPRSGDVRAFKFRDPGGHPLELLQFSRTDVPAS